MQSLFFKSLDTGRHMLCDGSVEFLECCCGLWML